jgi:hypothetical protein
LWHKNCLVTPLATKTPQVAKGLTAPDATEAEELPAALVATTVKV